MSFTNGISPKVIAYSHHHSMKGRNLTLKYDTEARNDKPLLRLSFVKTEMSRLFL